MCGIFGSIGKGADFGALRTLALANAERGNEAIGFFGSDGKIWKRAQSPIDALTGNKLNKYLAGAEGNGLWFVAGHTRHGTRGHNVRENAHPFRYGNIVGAHNGIVGAPTTYAVDSMYLIDAIHQAEGDYQKALGDVSGYWGLVWTDGAGLYLQAHNNCLAICKVGDVYYFSSDYKHLKAALGNIEYHAFTEGETMRLSINAAGGIDTANLKALECRGAWMEWDSRTQGGGRGRYIGFKNSGTSTGSGKYHDSATSDPFEASDPDSEYAALMGLKDRDPWNDVPDYDERWQDAWREYVGEYAD